MYMYMYNVLHVHVYKTCAIKSDFTLCALLSTVCNEIVVAMSV